MVEEWHRRNDACYKEGAPQIAMGARMCKYRDHLYYFPRYVFVELLFPSAHTAVHLVAAQTIKYDLKLGRLGNIPLSPVAEVTSRYSQIFR